MSPNCTYSTVPYRPHCQQRHSQSQTFTHLTPLYVHLALPWGAVRHADHLPSHCSVRALTHATRAHTHTHCHIYEDPARGPRPLQARNTRDDKHKGPGDWRLGGLWAAAAAGAAPPGPARSPRTRVFGEDCALRSSKHSLAKLMVSITGNADITESARTPRL